MTLFGWIGLFVLTLVGYSIGRILPARSRRMTAKLPDGALIALLWISSAVVKLPSTWPIHLAWPALALIAGAAHTLVAHPAPEPSEHPSEQQEKTAHSLKWLWACWKSFAFKLGNFQGRLILLIFYFTILMPFGIITSVFRDPLHLKRTNRPSYWFELHSEAKDIQDARRQF